MQKCPCAAQHSRDGYISKNKSGVAKTFTVAICRCFRWAGVNDMSCNSGLISRAHFEEDGETRHWIQNLWTTLDTVSALYDATGPWRWSEMSPLLTSLLTGQVHWCANVKQCFHDILRSTSNWICLKKKNCDSIQTFGLYLRGFSKFMSITSLFPYLVFVQFWGSWIS